MSSILWISSRRHLVRHPWISSLSIVGVALGVAVVVATDLASGSAQASFDLAAEAVTGRATHQIAGGPAGVPEELYVRIRTERGLTDSAPVVEGAAKAGAERRTMTLLGVDLFAERPFRSYSGESLGHRDSGVDGVSLREFLVGPGALLAAGTATALGLEPGDSIDVVAGGRQRELVLSGTLAPSDSLPEAGIENLLVVDVATAQELLGMSGRLSRIELRLPEEHGESPGSLERLLLPGTRIERAGGRTETAEELTRAFRLNLFTLSLLALLCGAFLIYNSVTFSVVMRRPVFGTLRSLGVTRRRLLGLVLGEALLVGLVGSLLGLALGRLLAQGLIGMVAQTISDHYFSVAVTRLPADPTGLATGLALGLAASALAGLRPAWEAARSEPRRAMQRSELERGSIRGSVSAALAGAASIGAGAAFLALSEKALWPSFAAVLAVLLGCALLAPGAVRLAGRLLAPPLGALFGSFGRLAARGLAGNLSRTGVAVAALMLALSVTIGIGLMITSFRLTVERWLELSLPADIYLMPPVASNAATAATNVEPEWLEAVAAVPGIGRINRLRSTVVESSAGEIQVVALDMDERGERAFSLRSGDAGAAWEAYHQGRGLLISEPLAFHAGLDVGSTIRLLTGDDGDEELPVVGVFYDYSSDRGYALLDLVTYQGLYGDMALTAASAFVDDPALIGEAASLASTVEAVRAALPEEAALVVTTQAALRERSIRVFDRTFRITAVLRTLTLLVAIIGIVSSLMAQQLERTRELGLLRASGLTRRQIWRLVTLQTGLIGLVAGLLSVPVGIAMAAMTTQVINRRSFGWTIPLEIDPAILWQALAAAVISALVAGLLPSLRMAATSPAEALRAE